MSQPKIFLVGLMAVGKTTIGRMLSEALQLPFYDSDAEIEARAGAEISWIFDMEGEEKTLEAQEMANPSTAGTLREAATWLTPAPFVRAAVGVAVLTRVAAASVLI